NVKPDGTVSSGATVTVTADVTVMDLADGTYDVTVEILDEINHASTIVNGTVEVTGGVGKVNIPNVKVPTGSSGDLGKTFVEVTDRGSGVSDVGSSDITWE